MMTFASLVPVCSQEDWGQMSAQSEEVSITEEDLELIKERETNIRQLEVGSSPLMADQQLRCSTLNLL